MTISIKTKSQNIPVVKDAVVSGGRDIPGYISADATQFSGQLLSIPHLDEIPHPLPINVPLICEFLAHNN
jgi:small subunit ribosomal protein S4